jgi:hypothetical protein
MTRALPMTGIEGQGEQAGRLRDRRILRTVALLGLVGGVVGVVLSLLEQQGRHGFTLPAWVAVLGVAVLVIGTTAGTLLYFRQVDEVELHANYWSANVTLYAYIIGYGSWYILWKAALVPEPSHRLIYIATFVVMIASYGWKKFRP